MVAGRPASLFIKIPAARQESAAIAKCLAEGISISVTLMFFMQRYDAVMDAFLDGMPRARRADFDLSPIASVASVASHFVSRTDSRDRLSARQGRTSEAAVLRGRAAIADAG